MLHVFFCNDWTVAPDKTAKLTLGRWVKNHSLKLKATGQAAISGKLGRENILLINNIFCYPGLTIQGIKQRKSSQ